MDPKILKKILFAALIAAAFWLGIKYILPVTVPFWVGALLALVAEPLVSVGVKRFRMPRALAAGIGVSLTLLLLVSLLSLVAAMAVKEVGNLISTLPDVEKGTQVLQDWLISAADRAPEGVRSLAQKTVLKVFDDGSAVVDQISRRIPSMLTGVVSGLGNSILSIFTGVLAAYFISARLPKLRRYLYQKMPESWQQTILPGLTRVYRNLGGWLKAQGLLMLVTWGIVTVGFFVLQISFAPAWAALVASVDAIPILGTGTVLIPWALISFLQGDSLGAIILLITYAAAAITRTILEPRLIGRQLGLDPLVTLFSVYAGYQFWGFWGLLLAPIAASAAISMLAQHSS